MNLLWIYLWIGLSLAVVAVAFKGPTRQHQHFLADLFVFFVVWACWLPFLIFCIVGTFIMARTKTRKR